MMTKISKAYVAVPEGQIHYHYVDGEGVPIVFLHQTALSAASYDPLLEKAALGCPLIAFDTPGFGQSFRVEGWPSLADYAGYLLRAIDALGYERVHVFGHHTGATLAIEMAAQRPEMVASIMLAGPVFMADVEVADFIAGYQEPIQPSRDGQHVLTNWNYAALYNPECDLGVLQDAVADMLRAWQARPQAYMAVAHHKSAEVAKGLGLPVALLTTKGDFFHSGFGRAKAVFPDALCYETGGDNFPMASDPHGVAAAIADFLAQRF